MSQNIIHRIAGVSAVLTLLLAVLALGLALRGDSDDGEYEGELIGEPLTEEMKEEYRGTRLEFIAETGRVIYRENGSGQIIWDPPELPTVRESVRMYREAVAKSDPDLVPLCSESFLRYLQAAKSEDESLNPDDPYFPACQAIPTGTYFGPPHGRSEHSSNNYHSGYNYQGTDVSEGINGAISIDNPTLGSDEWAAARFLMVRHWNGHDYWLEGGWAQNYAAFEDHDPHVYTQQCDSTQSTCRWHNFDNACHDEHQHNALVYIASQSDGNWDSFCWNFDTGVWARMWHDFDSGDDDADRLEAYFEVHGAQASEITMGNVRFYNLELRDATTWHDWTTTYFDDTAKVQEGGYTVNTTVAYYDFYVSNSRE